MNSRFKMQEFPVQEVYSLYFQMFDGFASRLPNKQVQKEADILISSFVQFAKLDVNNSFFNEVSRVSVN